MPTRPPMFSLRWLLAITTAFVVASPLALKAVPPPWWYDRGVIDVNAQQPPNDYAAVNQGQVKFIAAQAAAELTAHCPGGIVDPQGTIQNLLNTWGTPTTTTNDFTAVNLGALKALATPFYDQLIRVGYVSHYPWYGQESLANNYAAANIGQVKNLFAFDLTSTDAAHDANGDGLPDWWESFYGLTGVSASGTVPWNSQMSYLQAFQQGLNPKDFFDSHAPTFAAYGGDNQLGAPGEFLPQPLTVAVSSSSQPLVNAPITFTVTGGTGQVQRSSNSVPGASVTVLTDFNGSAKVYFKLSTGTNDQNEVTVKPGSGGYTAPVHVYSATASLPAGANPSPFNPSNVVATMNRDGSADVSWTNNADSTDDEPIDIRYKDRHGQWQVLTSVDGHATSYHIPAP